MSVLVKGMDMPESCRKCSLKMNCDACEGFSVQCLPLHRPIGFWDELPDEKRRDDCPLVCVPPHGDLIDRDALIKDGWLSLHKEVIRMGGYAIHELPLKNPLIPVIIPADGKEHDS